MARRVHRPSHALFTRPCGRCAKVLDYCGSCQPGRRYCGQLCSAAQRDESKRSARGKYNDRGSAEGLEVHRLEEADRRSRRADSGERVGDHRCRVITGALQVPASAAFHAAMEVSDAASPLTLEPLRAVSSAAPLEWTLVAWPEVLAAARRRLGREAVCPFCGRRGRIVRVVTLHEWRRRLRQGVG